MSRDLKQIRAVVRGVEHYSKLLRDFSKSIRSSASRIRKRVRFVLTPVMKVTVCEVLAELAPLPSLVFPGCDTIVDGSCPFHVYGDTCIDGFGAGLKQEQPDGSVRPNDYISRASRNS